MNTSDNQFRITLALEAQSPMIHFQAREPGATLRASEVKPKLDRFLIGKLEKQLGKTREELFEDKYCKPFFLPAPAGQKVFALAYSMQIFCEKPPTVVVIHNDRSLTKNNPAYDPTVVPDYPLYYANSGVKEPEEQRLGVVSAPTVFIRCFVPALRELIGAYLEEFFLVTNFGTMQSKGFGSFAPKGYKPDVQQISRYLKEATGTNICLLMQGRPGKTPCDFSNHFRRIECFYHLMKSGYNNAHKDPKTGKQQIDKLTKKPIPPEYEHSYLFQYMHDLGLNNEKAWMKENKISPVFSSVPRPAAPPCTQPARYVRALLGTAGNVSYLKGGGGRMSVTISSKEFARVPSPIFFKIIGNYVFIAAFPVEYSLYGKPFEFSGYKADTLSTPALSDLGGKPFDIADFLRQYADHYNKLVSTNKLPQYLKFAPKVQVIP